MHTQYYIIQKKQNLLTVANFNNEKVLHLPSNKQIFKQMFTKFQN